MLLLLADTRKKLLHLWLAAAAAVGLLVFVQTLAGFFFETERGAWLWVFAQLLPGLCFLFVAVLRNANPSKVLKRATFRAVQAAAAGYLALVFVTAACASFAARNMDVSIEAFQQISHAWLLPFQALLLVLFGLLYFQKEVLWQPGEAVVKEYIAKKSEFAHRNGNLPQMKALALLAADDGLQKTLAHLAETQKPSPDELVLLQSQSAKWKETRDLNLADPAFLQRELNRLTIATVHFIETNISTAS